MSDLETHPADVKLLRWLEVERPGRVGKHLLRCEVCLSRLERLSQLGPVATASVSAARSVPEEVSPLVAAELRDRIVDQEALSSFFDLFTLPWRTAEIVLRPATTTEEHLRGNEDEEEW